VAAWGTWRAAEPPCRVVGGGHRSIGGRREAWAGIILGRRQRAARRPARSAATEATCSRCASQAWWTAARTRLNAGARAVRSGEVGAAKKASPDGVRKAVSGQPPAREDLHRLQVVGVDVGRSSGRP